MPVAHCGRLAVSFLPQVVGFSVDFWADAPWPPDQCRAGAIPRPQMSIGSDARVMKNLPESS
jgi:hypothetical protein